MLVSGLSMTSQIKLVPADEHEGHVEAPDLQEERKQESLSSKFVIGQIFS